ncbi:uncharacterized protein [Palaemon carinicauda]|uniref:uncharacterized protein n=1 Tax=Palaemon carinicauda TaxID=392227 RepID=UPI0035B64E10
MKLLYVLAMGVALVAADEKDNTHDEVGASEGRTGSKPAGDAAANTRFLGGFGSQVSVSPAVVLPFPPVGGFGSSFGVNTGLGGFGGGFGVNQGFGGVNPGFVNPGFGSVAPPSTCRYWCRTPQGQAYCCENINQPQSFVGVKPGFCPPVRPVCPPVRSFQPPVTCSNDGSCGGVDKCCFDTCLQEHVCKPPQGFGR